MRYEVGRIFAFMVFIINPMLWSSYGIFEAITTNKRFSYFKIAVFFGVLGFSLFPWGDGYERFLVYEKAKIMTFAEFVIYGFSQGDVVFYIFSYILSINDVPYQFMQFISVFCGYLILLLLARRFFSPLLRSERYFLIMVLFFLVHFVSLANGIRYLLSTIILLYAIINFECDGRKSKFMTLFLLSIMTHFYAAIVFVIYFFSKRMALLYSKKTIHLIVFCLFICSSISWVLFEYIAVIFSNGDGFMERKIASYMLRGDLLITKMVSSPAQAVHYFFYQMPLLIFILYFVCYGDKNCIKTKTFLCFFALCLPFAYFFSIYLRLTYFCMLYGFLLLIQNWRLCRPRGYWLLILISFSFCFMVVELAFFKRHLEKDNISYVNEGSLCSIAMPPILLYKCAYTIDEIHMGNREFRMMKAESRENTMESFSGE